jgi:hypothetical protein
MSSEYDEMLKRLCCDLANDAAASEKGLIPVSTVQARLYGYAEEIAQALGYAGPASLREWKSKGRKGGKPCRRI